MPWRQAYKAVADNLSDLSTPDPLSVLKSARHTGATGNLGLPRLGQSIAREKKNFIKRQKIYQTAINKLLTNK